MTLFWNVHRHFFVAIHPIISKPVRMLTMFDSKLKVFLQHAVSYMYFVHYFDRHETNNLYFCNQVQRCFWDYQEKYLPAISRT